MLRLLLIAVAIGLGNGFFRDRWNLDNLIFDLQPVRNLVGRWQLTGMRGRHPEVYYPPNSIDFAINPIPKFGARTLNITMHWWDNGNPSKILRTDYGFLPVKNATRFDRRIHTAFLTTSSEGFSMQEQGFVELPGPQIRTHLKQFMKRSFDLAGPFPKLRIDQLERFIEVRGSRNMLMSIQTVTSEGQDDYTAEYQRVAP